MVPSSIPVYVPPQNSTYHPTVASQFVPPHSQAHKITEMHQLTRRRSEDIVTAMDCVTLWTWQSESTVEPTTRASWITSCSMTLCHGISTYRTTKSASMYTIYFVEKRNATNMMKSSHSKITMPILSPKWSHSLTQLANSSVWSWVIWFIILKDGWKIWWRQKKGVAWLSCYYWSTDSSVPSRLAKRIKQVRLPPNYSTDRRLG